MCGEIVQRKRCTVDLQEAIEEKDNRWVVCFTGFMDDPTPNGVVNFVWRVDCYFRIRDERFDKALGIQFVSDQMQDALIRMMPPGLYAWNQGGEHL